MWRGAAGSIPNPTPSGLTIPSPTFTGPAGFAAGTVGAPSIAWTDDQDGTGTGFYRAASNVTGFAVNGVGVLVLGSGSAQFVSGHVVGWTSSTTNPLASVDTAIARAAANSVVFAGAVTTPAGSATSRTEINKAVTAFSNAVAKDVFTVTVPNAAHNATIELRVMGALGAGGAIGAGEAMATNTYVIGIVRTAGVATVATATAAFGAVAVAVAGAATVTATAAVSAMSGAVGATQTFTITVTISRSGGSSDNHTCTAYAKLINANATGITIS